MTTATAARDTESKSTQADKGAVLFELEGIAAGGRRATYEALKKAFASHDVKFTAAQFSRFCLHPAVEFYAEELPEKIGARKVNGAKLIEEVKAALAEFYASSKAALNPGLAKLLEAAHKNGVEAGAISSLPDDLANNLLLQLGLGEKGVRLFTFANIESHFPRADVWLKVARQMGKSPRACIVVADHMGACKSALSASMKCVAACAK
jgi:beta-phosphoglucomutase-like phosphatase (HAD superfamily)